MIRCCSAVDSDRIAIERDGRRRTFGVGATRSAMSENQVDSEVLTALFLHNSVIETRLETFASRNYR